MSAAGNGYWEDFEVGQRYPTTSRKITEEDHLAFCRLVGYDVPLFLAVERGRFFGPVRPGDTIRTEVEVVEKKASSDTSRGVVTFRDHVINQREETVFQLDKITLLRRRTA